LYRSRAALLATICLLSLPAGAQTPAPTEAALPQATPTPPAPPPETAAKPRTRRHLQPVLAQLKHQQQGGLIQAIKITGNERIEDSTILSYMLVQAGDPFASDRVDRSLRTLYATGLFSDVSLKRDGDTLVVHVVENPLVNNISFEGNHNVKEDDLKKGLNLRPRAVFTPRMAQQDRTKLLGVYAGHGRFAATVDPEIIRLPQNRVNVIFKIVEGPETDISRIIFIGNKAFSEGDLKAVIESREERWWRFLSSSDQFNPERVNFDRELIRRFYLEHGYADVQVTNTVAELSPDRKAFFLTFQIIEGERYRVGKITVKSTAPKIQAARYRDLVKQAEGAYYNGSLVEKTSDVIQAKVRLNSGDPFLVVNPKIARNPAKRTVDLEFDIANGKKTWVERIDISGNTITRDKVIRREFRFAEGDPNDSTLVRITKQRLTDLGYFTDVKITPTPGSATDRVIMDTSVTEKATGELSLGGGYSTTAGILGQAGLRQHNLIGTGIDAGINGTIGTYESQVDISATDPYFLDRNLVAGGDIFYLNNNNYYVSDYSETRIGLSARMGFAYNDHVSQAFNYTVSDRDVNHLSTYASDFVQDEQGWTLLSQLGQTITFDWRDSRLNPHTGFVIRLGTDVAGLGGDEHYLRSKIDSSFFLPLDWITGNSLWGFSFSQGAGYLWNLQSKELIIDRFFLGGDNLRGFLDQGAGPHSVAYSTCLGSTGVDVATPKGGCVPASNSSYPTPLYHGADPLGGNFIWTQSSEFHYPLPVPQDFGLSGRAFVDMGGLSGLNAPPTAAIACLGQGSKAGYPNLPVNKKGQILDDHGDVIGAFDKATGKSTGQCYYDSGALRLSVGIGFSWKSPFGLINIDFGIPILKEAYDQKQFFKFGFGTRFQ
jgi:outer membrane protein insertion porin family